MISHFSLSALLSVLCYTEFSAELPVAGGSFAYLRLELGGFIGRLAAENIPFEYGQVWHGHGLHILQHCVTTNLKISA